jgi:N-acetylmuramoyl-L-alanine amidase
MVIALSERYSPQVKTTILSPNHSSREGAHPTLIVIHATVSHNVAGLADLNAIGNWFSRTSTQASSHVCTDNEGNSARFVADELKAWHCSAYNRMALGIEQVLPSTGSHGKAPHLAGDEVTHELYCETARWVAYWSKKFGIPIRIGAVHNGAVMRSGVVRHSGLGVLGGNHFDPGKYDMTAMLTLARFYRSKI